jgi:hypothetical protein
VLSGGEREDAKYNLLKVSLSARFIATRSLTAMSALTTYEEQQIHEIAGWKAEAPALLLRTLDAISHPFVKIAEKYVPEQLIKDAIKVAYTDAETLSHQIDVAKRAHVSDVHELRQAELSKCDRLAERFARIAAARSAVRGAAMTAGPVLGMELSIMFALKTVHTIAFCYGFTPHDPKEKQYVLQTLLVASAGSLAEKQQAVINLRNLVDVMLDELAEDFVTDETEAMVDMAVEEFAGNSMPLIGLAFGAVTNATVTYRTAEIAKRVFQERWLRQNGKVESIAADPHFARNTWQRTESVFSACVYWPSFISSFALAFPTALLASYLPRQNVAVRGLVDGRADASHDARDLSKRLREAVSFESQAADQPAPAVTPAPA